MATTPSWVIGGNAYSEDTFTPAIEELSTAVTSLSTAVTSLSNWVMKAFPYAETTEYKVTVPQTPTNGHTYLLLVKNYTSSSTYTFDVIAFAFAGTETVTIDGSYLVNNSSGTISSVTYDGTEVTITFSAKKYMSAYLLRCA